MFAVSLLSPRGIRRVAIVGFLIALALTAATMVIGIEIKGARRWISLPGMSHAAQRIPEALLRRGRRMVDQRGHAARRASPAACSAFGVFLVIALLLKSQPDIGMLAVITAVFLAQLYVAGLNLIVVGVGMRAARRRRRLPTLSSRMCAAG